MKATLVVGALLALAGSAMGQTISPYTSGGDKAPGYGNDYNTNRGTTNTIVPFDVTGIESWDPVSDASNVVIEFDIAAALGLPSGSSVTMTSIGWDVTLTAFSPSWRSEIGVYMDDNIAPDLSGLFLRPGVADSTPGTGTYSSGGQVDLSDNAIPNVVLPNGIMRLEFYESFDDFSNGVDGTWDAGQLLIGVAEIPAPASLALLGLGGLVAGRRRR
jgi:hypothetical protein